MSIEVSETQLLNHINRAKAHKLGRGWSPDEAIALRKEIQARPLERIEDVIQLLETVFGDTDSSHIDEMAQEWIGEVHDSLSLKVHEKTMKALTRVEMKTANRAEYLRAPLFIRYETEEAKKRWIFEQTLRPRGLLELVVNHLHGEQEHPAAIAILMKTDETDTKEAMLRMREQGYAISGGRLGIYRHGPGWNIATKALPKAIWFSAYVHGLVAPILPNTYVAGGKLTFAKINVDGRDLKTDGSGIYHPDAPEVQALVAKYGLVPFQIRALQAELGMFAKGVLFPSEKALDENGNPACVLDWNMVKGRCKERAMQRRGEDLVKTVKGFHYGALQVWNRRTYLSATFELLEVIRRTPRTELIVKRLVDKGMKRLIARGLDGVAADIAKKDEVLQLFMQLMTIGKLEGLNIHPMQIPRFEEAIRGRMDRLLYKYAVGAGFKAPIHVARLDALVPRGCAVVPGYEVGATVATYRFPMILSQGAVTVKVIAPPAHLLIDGKLTPHTIVMNPADLVLGMQGDDDGDFLGVTDDPDIVELFENRLDNQKFRIEPKGVPVLAADGKELMVDCDEGLNFVMYDQRGPVGMLTMWRSSLLAVGDNMGATALSILIQEAIDQAKRRPQWTDWRAAAEMRNWTKLDDGTYVCKVALPTHEYENGTLPITKVREWVRARLVQAGSFYIDQDNKAVGKSSLWWRQLGKGRRINTADLNVPEENDALAQHENLVHTSTRHVLSNWHRIVSATAIAKTRMPAQMLLPTLLAMKGMAAGAPSYDWEQLKALRNKWGLSTYNSQVNNLPDGDEEDQKKHRAGRVLSAQTQLEERLRSVWNLEEAVMLWTWELSDAPRDGRQGPNPNNAWRAICWPGSPMLQILGIEETTSCRFLHTEDRMKRAMDSALRGPDPFHKLKEILLGTKNHQLEVMDEEGNPVYIHECPTCMKLLTDGLVGIIRTQKAKKQTDALRDLHERLKG